MIEISLPSVALFPPARQALVPNLVPARDLPSAFSMNSIAFQTGAIIGPAISGMVIAIGGMEYIYLLNAGSYIGVIAALLAIGSVAQTIQPGKPKISIQSIQEGITFIRNQPTILATMILDFLATFFSSANTLLPIITRDVLRAGPIVYGWLSAAQSVGAVFAAVIVSQFAGLRRQGTIFLSLVVVFGLATQATGDARLAQSRDRYKISCRRTERKIRRLRPLWGKKRYKIS